MLLLANRVQTAEEGKALLLRQIENGQGLAKFRELLEQQGGDVRILSDESLLSLSPCMQEVLAEQSGFITHMNTAKIGRASQETGAGRAYKGQPLDFGAGIVMKKRLGDPVEKGEALAMVYSGTQEKASSAAEILRSAISIGSETASLPPLVLEIISE